MATKKLQYTNGGTIGNQVAIDATIAGDGALLIDFNVSYDFVAVFQVQDASGVNVPLADAVVTYPAEGQVKLENGAATFALADGQVVNVIAFRRR